MAFGRKKKDTDAPAAEEVLEVAEPVAQEVSSEEQKNERRVRPSSHERREVEEARAARSRARQDDLNIIMKYAGAHNSKAVLEGTVGGVEVRGGHTFLAVYDGPVTILIPFHLTMDASQRPAGIEGDVVREQQLLAKQLGSTVAFIVDHVESGADDTYLASGSRIAANAKIRARYFGEDAVNPVSVGQVVTGRFYSVGRHSAWVNVLGVDVPIHKRFLSHRYMDDLEKYYAPGDKIKLQVMSLEDENGDFALSLSALPCELEEAKPYLHRAKRGTRCVATLAGHRMSVNKRSEDEMKEYSAHMWLEELQLPAYAKVMRRKTSDNESIYEGTKVMVSVDGVSNSGYVRVTILRMLI